MYIHTDKLFFKVKHTILQTERHINCKYKNYFAINGKEIKDVFNDNSARH